jgi:AcrR family transcriptional regulator
MNTRKLNALETRNKIYNAAKNLFKKYGFENVSVDSIVEAAGVAKGSFYVHFDTKDSMVAEFISDYVNKIDADYKSYIDSFDARTSASDILLCLIEKITDILIHEIGYAQIRTLYKIQITKTADIDAVLSYNREIYKLFHDILSKGIQQKEFKTDIPIEELTKHCMVAIRGITYEWCIRYPDFDYKEEALQHFCILLSGIKK